MKADVLEIEQKGEMARLLKDLRKKSNLTAERFANLLGLSKYYLANLESGTTTELSTEEMFRIAEVLGNFDVVRNRDININQYNTQLAETIQVCCFSQEMSKIVSIKDQLQTMMESAKKKLSNDDYILLNRYLEQLKYLHMLKLFVYEAKRRVKQGSFVQWLNFACTELLKCPSEMEKLDSYFERLDTIGEKDIDSHHYEFSVKLMDSLRFSSVINHANFRS